MTGYEIRRATTDDVPRLRAFFAAAYSETSVFVDDDFVQWFLGARTDLLSMIAVASNGNVVGHYGAVRSEVLLDGECCSMLWGVNAYTLAEYRGSGLGERLARPWYTAADIFGVIGFSPHTASFYERSGFELFQRQRFVRQVCAIDERMFDIVAALGGSVERARAKLPLAPVKIARAHAVRPSIEMLGWNDDPKASLTTRRTRDFLRWRFVDQRWLSYDLLAIVERNRARAYVATRRTRLEPRDEHVVRIVDAYGESDALADLSAVVVAESRDRGDLWVDFSATRTLPELTAFTTLVGDDVSLLPTVTSPMQHRDNNEFLGLFSVAHKARLAELTFNDIYFTRLDSDRDRAVRLPDKAPL